MILAMNSSGSHKNAQGSAELQIPNFERIRCRYRHARIARCIVDKVSAEDFTLSELASLVAGRLEVPNGILWGSFDVDSANRALESETLSEAGPHPSERDPQDQESGWSDQVVVDLEQDESLRGTPSSTDLDMGLLKQEVVRSLSRRAIDLHEAGNELLSESFAKLVTILVTPWLTGQDLELWLLRANRGSVTNFPYVVKRIDPAAMKCNPLRVLRSETELRVTRAPEELSRVYPVLPWLEESALAINGIGQPLETCFNVEIVPGVCSLDFACVVFGYVAVMEDIVSRLCAFLPCGGGVLPEEEGATGAANRDRLTWSLVQKIKEGEPSLLSADTLAALQILYDEEQYPALRHSVAHGFMPSHTCDFQRDASAAVLDAWGKLVSDLERYGRAPSVFLVDILQCRRPIEGILPCSSDLIAVSESVYRSPASDFFVAGLKTSLGRWQHAIEYLAELVPDKKMAWMGAFAIHAKSKRSVEAKCSEKYDPRGLILLLSAIEVIARNIRHSHQLPTVRFGARSLRKDRSVSPRLDLASLLLNSSGLLSQERLGEVSGLIGSDLESFHQTASDVASVRDVVAHGAFRLLSGQEIGLFDTIMEWLVDLLCLSSSVQHRTTTCLDC